jgi:DNA-binding beta-propeller fold protein YncE
LVVCWCLTSSAWGQTKFDIPTAAGGVLAGDGKTLIVSSSKTGQLLYFDTVEEKEAKRVELDFRPDRLAIQGDTLFAVVKGSAKVAVLEAATGKELKQIQLPGDPIESLACHPSRGLLYATNKADQVYSIDPASGKVAKTKARGQKLVVDPVDGKTVYTGIQKPIRDVIVIQEGPNKSLRVSLDKANLNAMMMKFRVEKADLVPLAVNDNVAINGKEMAVSPDGKQVAMAGGGGWKPASEARYNYSIAVFETKDITTLAGQIETGPYPVALTWHPQLSLGVAKTFGSSELILFNARSLAEKKRIKVNDGDPAILAFAAQGTKLAHVSNEIVTLLPLELTDQDREKLKSASSGDKSARSR